MAVTQIVGPRIAPYWADPVEWTSTRAYEPFTFVTYQGDSYCSRQDTPIGIDITNDDYWVKVSDYNAQAVALQREMTNTIEAAESSMESTIEAAESSMESTINMAESNMAEQVSAVENVKTTFQDSLDSLEHITPFDTTPTSGSVKGVTSGGVYASVNNLLNMQDTYLIFGDSWTVNNNARYCGWAWQLCQDFSNIHTYGVYGSTIPEIESQIRNASNDTSFENQSVRKVLIISGVNEINNSATTKVSEINAICDKIHAVFPNAMITWAHDASTPYRPDNYHLISTCTAIANSALKCSFISLPHIMIQPYLFTHDENDITVNGYRVGGVHASSTAGFQLLRNMALSVFTGTPQVLLRHWGGNSLTDVSAKIYYRFLGSQTYTLSDSTIKLDNYTDKLTVEGGRVVFGDYTRTLITPSNTQNTTQFGYYHIVVPIENACNVPFPVPIPMVDNKTSGAFQLNKVSLDPASPSIITIDDNVYIRFPENAFLLPQGVTDPQPLMYDYIW